MIPALPETAEQVLQIPTSCISPDPEQPRKDFDPEYINWLGDSILSEGLLQPITVRPAGKPNHYLIVAGECRWRAHALKGIQYVRCMVKAFYGEESKRFRAQVLENMNRRNMKPKEEAFAIEKLAQLGDSDAVIAQAVGMEKYRVQNLRRMTKLSESCWQLIESGVLATSLVEKAVAVIAMDQVEGVLDRCIGKNCKQASAILVAWVNEQRQDEFMLTMDEVGLTHRKPEMVRDIAAILVRYADLVESLSYRDQMTLARKIGDEANACIASTKKNRAGAIFLRQLFHQFDCVMDSEK